MLTVAKTSASAISIPNTKSVAVSANNYNNNEDIKDELKRRTRTMTVT